MLRRRRAFLACIVALAFGATAPTVSAAEATTANAVPLAFKVPATKGWSASVYGGFDANLGRGFVALTLTRRGERATYVSTAVTGSETAIDAGFGALGEIDVHSVATGGTTSERA